MSRKIGFIGCGNMGKAMLGALVKSNDINNDNIIVSTKSEESAKKINKEFQVQTTVVNTEVAEKSNVLFLAVKPYFFKAVIEEIKDSVSDDTIIISIAAGITIAQIEEWFGKKVKVVRTMPNTPALVGEGMSAVCPNKNITLDELEYVGKLYNSFGICIKISSFQAKIKFVSNKKKTFIVFKNHWHIVFQNLQQNIFFYCH